MHVSLPRHRVGRGLAVALAVCAMVSTAEAQSRKKRARAGAGQGVELGVFIGAHTVSADTPLARVEEEDPQTHVVSSANTTPGAGVPFGLRVGFRLAPEAMIELEGQVMYSSTRDSRGDGAVFGYRGHLQYRFGQPDWRARPFLLGGIGAHTALIGRSLEDVNDTVLLGTVGAGLELAFTERVAMRLDVRSYLGAGDLGASVAVDTAVLVGVCWSSRRTCGYEPPGDDAYDDVDIEDAPERDSDGDGVFGKADRCPITPEDRDGVQDDDGCPDLDNDGDGVEEPTDRCPDQAENVNGWDDFDGCPEELPSELARFDGVVTGIKFRAGTAVFLPQSYDALDELAAGLDRNGVASVKITVHMAREGDEDFTQRLSDERAAGIRQYLLDKGIDGDRVRAYGAGSKEPLASTPEDRSNERVEIRFVAGD